MRCWRAIRWNGLAQVADFKDIEMSKGNLATLSLDATETSRKICH